MRLDYAAKPRRNCLQAPAWPVILSKPPRPPFDKLRTGFRRRGSKVFVSFVVNRVTPLEVLVEQVLAFLFVFLRVDQLILVQVLQEF